MLILAAKVIYLRLTTTLFFTSFLGINHEFPCMNEPVSTILILSLITWSPILRT